MASLPLASSSSSSMRQQLDDFLRGRAPSTSSLPTDNHDEDEYEDDDEPDASSNHIPPPQQSTSNDLLQARLDRLAVILRTNASSRSLRPEDFDGDNMHIADEIHFPNDLAPEVAAIWRQRVRLVESEARHVAEEFCREFEDTPIVRIAVREFYTSILKRYQESCFPPDPRGQRSRNMSQEICAQAIDRHVWLNQFEKGLLARASRCPPQSAENFWRHTFQHRLNFLVLKDIIDLQRQRQREQE